MKLINNLVLIRHLPNDEIRLVNGSVLYVDTRFEEYLHAPVVGIVEAVPEKLSYPPMPWITDMELQVGDKVIFNYLSVRTAEQLGYKLNRTTYFIPYRDCYVVFRENKIVCLNGNILVEPIIEDDWTTAKIDLLKSDLSSERSKTEGIVRYAGNPTSYIDEDTGVFYTDSQVFPGDEIVFHWSDAIPLQPNQEIKGEISRNMFLYRMRHCDVLGKRVKPHYADDY